MSHRLSIYAIFVSVLVGLSLSSCGSSRKVTSGGSAYKGKGKSGAVVSPPSMNGYDPVAKALIHEAENWIGVPYKYGGNDRNGVDCSGFVTQVYLRALDIKLPRSSREQCDFCQKVSRSSLTPGDLLFFSTTKGSDRISHVGIFVGENKMIHSSTSKGVIYTDLGTDYYVRTYACAGKVGQYHAKLSRKQKSGEKKSKNKKETKPTAPEALPREIPVEIHVDELDRVLSSASGRDSGEAPAVRQAEAPVTAKAENNVTSKPETKNSPAPVTTPTPVKAIGSQNNTSRKPAPSLTEPTVEDARSSVLNSIKEKEL